MQAAAIRTIIVMLLCSALIACQRGPDESALYDQVQAKLDAQFRAGLLKVSELHRKGSEPFVDEDAPGKRLRVYFNAKIEFLQDYDFSLWDALGVRSLASTLGAMPKGVAGINPAGNKKGDILKVYGISTYIWENDSWAPVLARSAVAGKASPVDELGNPESDRSVLSRLSTVLRQAEKDIGFVENVVIKEEIDIALRSISLRFDKKEGAYSLLTGQVGGEYHRLGNAAQRVLQGAGLRLNSYASAGSIENCHFINDQAADLALVQNNVAAMAYNGEGPFKSELPMKSLRAVASLFPEPIQIIVLESSDIHVLSDLRGKKIDIDFPGSGANIDNRRVLKELGFTGADLSALPQRGVTDAIKDLKSGAIDALMTTRAAPAAEFQDLAVTHPIRLLSLDPAIMEKVIQQNDYYVPVVLPANTYPGRNLDVHTLAVTAMLIVNKSMPPERLRKFIVAAKANMGTIASEVASKADMRPATVELGVSVPWHPVAKEFLAKLPPS